MSELGFGPLDASSLSRRALVQIRDRILAGSLPAQRWLRIADLAEELGTSITPVRAALTTLEQRGLIEVAKARGFRIIPPTREDIQDSYLITAFVSGELAARAAAVIDAESLEHCQTLQARMEAVWRGESEADIDDLNWGFHRRIHGSSGSSRLLSVLRTIVPSVPHDFHRLVPDWTAIALKQHRNILDALERHDAVAARAAASNHVKFGCDMLLEDLELAHYWEPAAEEIPQ